MHPGTLHHVIKWRIDKRQIVGDVTDLKDIGGRFSFMLKYAGWDGIVIEGQADEPVWLDIRNDTVTIEKEIPIGWFSKSAHTGHRV